MKRYVFGLTLCAALLMDGGAQARRKPQTTSPPVVENVEAQPLTAQVRRIIEALDYLGEPLPVKTRTALQRAFQETDEKKQVRDVQAALDPYCIAFVDINPESRVKVAQAQAKPELVEQGWRQFLVKVRNQAGVTSELRAASPNARSLFNSPKNDLQNRWLELQMFNNQPLNKGLSGLPLEYRIIQLYSRDEGRREAKLSFNVGQGTQDIGFRNEADILFRSLSSAALKFRVLDEDNKPTTAMFLIRDKLGRVYPSQAKRLAPDFAFHPQVYRKDGETLKLPRGQYNVICTRGPEYIQQNQNIQIQDKATTVTFRLRRWVDPAKSGWWSGDHHIHAAGCAHYTDPTQGVHAPDMIRQCLGEDLKIGANLTWGPCFDYQKQFFTGKEDKVSQYPYLLRYDIEVSGFGSHESGHLCLLRLADQMYPGGDSDKHWPKLGLNTLKWAQKQGAVCGPAHSAFGLFTSNTNLPHYEVPPYDGIGANEYIVDVTHNVPGPNGTTVPAVDFISTMDTPYPYELNIWYHTLNCGYRTRISGETDFPCITGERVGIGRSYVKVDGKLTYEKWCEGIEKGRCYVSEGRSHLMDFRADNVALGENGSELKIASPRAIKLTAKAAALLGEKPDTRIQSLNVFQFPYWHVERSRLGDSREVAVEVIVNGYPVGRKTIVADGTAQDITFDVNIARSSWVALRILGSSHTNPIFVLVGDKPIRASKRSAEWCLKSVEQCWKSKQRFYPANEKEDALAAYDHARESYRKILAESDAE